MSPQIGYVARPGDPQAGDAACRFDSGRPSARKRSMTRRQLSHRLRARLAEERGFTILETVIALFVIFASLTALMYTATSGFRDIAGDTRIKTPADCGDGAYHFLTCSGEKIVHDATATNATPLVPHKGTLLAPEYPTDYSWSTYITNSNPANDPYRITVIVSWTGGNVSGA